MNSIQIDRARQIIALREEVAQHLRTSLEKAIEIGRLLAEQKAALAHGKFGPWVTENLPFSTRTARNYMRVYNERSRLKTETLSDLAGAYKFLSRSPLDADREPDWLPAAGEFVAGHCQVDGKDRWLLLWRPAEDPDYVEVYQLRSHGRDQGGVLEGCRRGIQAKYVEGLLSDTLGTDPSLVTWRIRKPSDGREVAKCREDLKPGWLVRVMAENRARRRHQPPV